MEFMTNGIGFSIVGMADQSVRESYQRIAAALQYSGFSFPHFRITVNLSPADERKEGASFDLPIAIGLLTSSEMIKCDNLGEYMMMGELSLDGSVMPVKGALPMAIKAREMGFKRLIVPEANVTEAAVVNKIDVFGVKNLAQVAASASAMLNGGKIDGRRFAIIDLPAPGGPTINMLCPPAHATSNARLTLSCPFTSRVGGGANPMPGEISLAHNGVLFLDEFPEFPRHVLEVMRQPIEDRVITVARAKYTVNYPASFMLVASMNPCPCGYYGHPTKSCTCTPGQVSKYMNKISGPLLDRIDIQVEIEPVAFDDIADKAPAESSVSIRDRVMKARTIQQERYRNLPGIHCNAQMNSRLLHEYAWPDEEGLSKLKERMTRLNMSARAFDRILRVARTIADLDSSERVESRHIAEAIGYRSLDRASYGKTF